MFKVNNKTPNRHHRRRFLVVNVNFEQISNIVLMFPLLILNKMNRFHTLLWCFFINFEQVNVGWDEVLSDTFSSIFFEALQSYLKNLNL